MTSEDMSVRPTCRHAIAFLLLLFAGLAAGCGKPGPPYSPDEALKKFQLPKGFRIELVASEPQIVDPVAMAFDEDGRLYVVEMRDYPVSDQPLSRIKLLEDRDGDGRYEYSTVFAENLHFANGVMPWKKGVLVTSAPDILYFEDTDGDGRADLRRVVLTGFARVNPQLRVNAPTYGMDNWIYVAYPKFGAGRRLRQFSDLGQPIYFPDHPAAPAADAFSRGMDVRFKPDRFQVEAVSGNSQFGLAFDARGHRFLSWNDKHIRQAVIEDRYLARNPYLAAGSPMQSPSDHEDAAEVYPITENSHLKEIRESALMAQLGHFTSACGQTIYTGGAFPEQYQGAYFVCEPVSNLVHCDLLTPKGATFTARRAHERTEFLASKDSWSMPVNTANGPDGALYVVDFYRQIVEHPEWIRKDLMNDQALFAAGSDRGRIYRIVRENAKAAPKPRLRAAASADLVREVANPNRWWRVTAQRLLVERQDASVIPALKEALRQSASDEGRMHALWTIAGLGGLDADLVLQALADGSPGVREQAIRLAEGYLSDARVVTRLTQMTDEPDDLAQFQLACTLGLLPAEQSFGPLTELAARHLADSWFQVAVLTSAAENPARWFRALYTEPPFMRRATSEGSDLFLRHTASIIGARQRDGEITLVLSEAQNFFEYWQIRCLEGLVEGMRSGANGKIRLSTRGQQLLLKMAGAASPKVSNTALDLADHIRLDDTPQMRALLRQAAETARDEGGPVEARVKATRLLGLDPALKAPPLEQLLAPAQPEEVQTAAARALIGIPGPGSTRILLSHWAAYTASVRETVLAGLLSQPDRVAALLDAVEAGKVQPGSLSRSTRHQLIGFRDEKIRRRAERLFAGTESDRSAVLAKYRAATQMSGDSARGLDVYKQNCMRCHKLGDLGYALGPDLATISGRSKEELLENILDPNANIVSGYEEYTCETRDRRTVSGILVNQNATSVTLRRGPNEEDTVLRSNILELRASMVSAMPEGLERLIDLQQMADLLAYLRGFSAPQNRKAGIHGHF
jgi:putative membrane-bound dehydrogenase-like protein